MNIVSSKDLDYYISKDHEQAIDDLDDKLQQVSSDEELLFFKLIKSRMYYYQGRSDLASQEIQTILDNSEMDNNRLLELRIWQSIYLFGLGTLHESKNELDEVTSDLSELDTSKISNFPILGTYYYASSLHEEYHGNYETATDNLLQSITYFEAIDRKYDLQISHYKLATIYRTIGDINSADQHLEKSLDLAVSLNLEQEIATFSTLLGQDALMMKNFDRANDYLEQGLTNWEKVNSPFGTAWVLGELAFLNYHRNNKTAAYRTYSKLYETIKDHVPPIHQSTHLLNLIRFSLDIDEPNKARDHLTQLNQLPDEEIINKRKQLGRSLIEFYSNRLSTKLGSMHEFRQLSEVKDAMVKIEALYRYLILLGLEYDLSEEKFVKDKIQTTTKEKLAELLQYIHLHNGITFDQYTSGIIDNIDVLGYDIQSLVTSVRKEEPSDPKPVSGMSDSFEFVKELHSIPKLKILLYLLPRNTVSFSELMDNTGLSSGNISSQVDRLEELGYISRRKVHNGERFISQFSFTPRGYLRLREYLMKLSNYLDDLLIG